MFNESEPKDIIARADSIVGKFKLSKKAKDKYLTLREHYNKKEKTALNLFVLQIYAFQNMIRFNEKLEMNTPIGNNEYSDSIKNRILNFKVKAPKVSYKLGSYKGIKLENLLKGTVFYFDPPYFITKAEYNDGKRGMSGWNSQKESELLNHLFELDKLYDLSFKNIKKYNFIRNILIEAFLCLSIEESKYNKLLLEDLENQMNITRYTIYKKIRNNQFPNGRKLNGHRVFTTDEIQTYYLDLGISIKIES
jgi:adenine-specific DNA-methyltransferase